MGTAEAQFCTLVWLPAPGCGPDIGASHMNALITSLKPLDYD